MKSLGLAFLGLAAIAIVGMVFIFALSSGTQVTVVSLADVDAEALEEVKDILPIEPGVYCDFQGCCSDHDGIDSLDLRTGAVLCKDGEIIEDSPCYCPRQGNLITLSDKPNNTDQR